jgi:hypothetical protein
MSMYQAYPGGAPQVPGPPAPPPSVLNAVKLMYAGAALSAIGLILSLVAVGSLRANIIARDHGLTSSQIHAAEVIAITFAVIIGLLGIALWLLMAWANKRGRNWARIVASVLFGLDTVLLLVSLAQPHAVEGLLLAVLTWLAGLGAIFFLWQRSSSDFFQAVSGR